MFFFVAPFFVKSCFNCIFQFPDHYHQTLDSYYKNLSPGVYFCLACGYKASNSNMRKHVERKHLQNIEYKCTMCDKVSKTEEYRKKHYERIHRLDLSIAEIADLIKFQ